MSVRHNGFRHQRYRPLDEPSDAPVEYLTANLPVAEASAESLAADRVREAFERSDWDAVYLVHGTFAGEDETGILRELQRVSPSLAQMLRRQRKEWFDQVAHETGNYTDEFADLFARWTRHVEPYLPVRRFAWSGENHHLGRAEGAVLLLDELLQVAERTGKRCFLLWGHSHAGNVFALLTNLLGSQPSDVQRFFEATEPFVRKTAATAGNERAWRRVKQMLLERDQTLDLRLDLVTFGTPVRYGWDAAGYRSLLHIIHHRPAEGWPAERAPFPFTLEDLRTARHGDYIQQLGIAGTNFLPFLFSWRSWVAERRLAKLLQAELNGRFQTPPFQLGVRVPDEGATLLVDYPLDEQKLRTHLLGHAIYTRTEYLLYHLQLVTDRLPCREMLAERSA